MKIILALSLIANVILGGLLFIIDNNFRASSERHGEFIKKLTLWEAKNGCLGPELDDYFWLAGCSSPSERRHQANQK